MFITKPLSRTEIRELDRRAIEELGIPGIILMENAGKGIADYLFSIKIAGPVAICCGKGNNAGDGFVVARYLNNKNIPVRVLLFSPPEKLTGDAAIHYHIIKKCALSILYYPPNENLVANLSKELANATCIVDALFGTGLIGIVKAPYDEVINIINQTPATIVAVDIPSGLDCDTGLPLGSAIHAQHTVTFSAPKKGFSHSKAKRFLGKIHVVDIGIPRILQC